MKKGMWAMALAVASVTGSMQLFAADPPAPKATVPAPKADAEVKQIPGVPQRPLDVLQRFMTVTPEQQTKVTDLRTDYLKDRQEMLERVEQQLDAKYADQVMNALDGAQKAAFKQIHGAVTAYWAALKKADTEYRDAWVKAAGETPRSLPMEPIMLYAALADTPQQKDMARKLQQDYWKALNAARQEAMADAGLKAPTAGRDANWQEYQQKMQKIGADVTAKVQKDFIERIRTEIKGAAAEKHFDALLAAQQAGETKKKAAMDELVTQLKKLVPAERLAQPGYGGPSGGASFGPTTNR